MDAGFTIVCCLAFVISVYCFGIIYKIGHSILERRRDLSHKKRQEKEQLNPLEQLRRQYELNQERRKEQAKKLERMRKLDKK